MMNVVRISHLLWIATTLLLVATLPTMVHTFSTLPGATTRPTWSGTPSATISVSSPPPSSSILLHMGLFDKFSAFGSGASKERLDEQWEAQQEILRNRRKPAAERDAYFQKVEQRRADASKKQTDQWAWQTKTYAKGEDPINEWKKRRADGTISDLDNQYGDPKKIGGIPLPSASFGVGGEFGVGGKYDNGGRFDLRLPYADQGYVDEDADFMGKLGAMFTGGSKKPAKATTATDTKGALKSSPSSKPAQNEPKKSAWPW
jgi:hypothetical protein